MAIENGLAHERWRSSAAWRVAVVIPCYRVREHILGVLEGIGKDVELVYVVDDACPEQTGQFVREHCADPRVCILEHEENEGVGAAVMTGYVRALADGADIVVKVDGDGQMDPALIPNFVAPIQRGEADYTKGNRFYDLRQIRRMPGLRLFGNAVLSFVAKLSTGYWDVFDPTNGYTAIHRDAARRLPLDRISRRYFFETDLLFRLNTLRAVVRDVSMDAVYGHEQSSLRIKGVFFEFLAKHARNFCKRIFYNYFLRDVSVASFELVFGLGLLAFGGIFGAYHWMQSADAGVATPTGTIMISALTVLSGLQLLIAFIGYDISAVPKHPIQR